MFFSTATSSWHSFSKYLCVCMYELSRPVFSASLWPSGLQPARLLCPWVFQTRILEWVATYGWPRSSWTRYWTHISSFLTLAGRFFTAYGHLGSPPRVNAYWPSSTCCGEESDNSSNILAWRIPQTEEPDGLQSMGLQRDGQDCRDRASTHKVESTRDRTSRSWEDAPCPAGQADLDEPGQNMIFTLGADFRTNTPLRCKSQM